MAARLQVHPHRPRGHRELLAGYHLHATDGSFHVQRPGGADDWQLLVTLKGCGRVQTANGPLMVGRDVVLLWPPRVPNDYVAANDIDGWDYAWVHFLPLARWRHLLPAGRIVRVVPIPDTGQRAALSARMRELVALANGAHPRPNERSSNALEDVLLRIDEWLSAQDRVADHEIARATAAMAEHPEHRWPIDALIRLTGLSRTRFLQRFRSATGSTPHAWLELLRLERAAMLLRTRQHTLAEVAKHIGFCSPYHFSNRFLHHFGHRPGGRPSRQRPMP